MKPDDDARATTLTISCLSAPAPPSSPCPKCGINLRSGRGYCLECDRDRKRAAAAGKKIVPKRCAECGGRLPHGGTNRCPEQQRRYYVERGRQRLNTEWPAYGTVLTDDALLERVGKDWPHVAGFPPPSRLFPNLDPRLDGRLKQEGRDKDVTLCQALAARPQAEQREFLELYLKDPADARRWAALPSWKRPLRHGDPDDHQIWKFFTIYRLNMEHQAAHDAPPWPMDSQGAQLRQLFGTLARLSLAGVARLCLLMTSYGAALHDHRDLGDVVKKPWDV